MESDTNRLLGLSCGGAGGSVEILLKAALQAAERDGARVEMVRLDELRIVDDSGEPDSDIQWLWEKLMACDGIVLSTPVISRSVSPRLKLLADVMLGPNADAVATEEILAATRAGGQPPVPFRADERVLKPRVAGFIAVGGSAAPRWKTLTLPLMHVTAFPMRMTVVDQVEFAGGGSPRSIVLDVAAVDRAADLGRNMASQLGRARGDATYLGTPGLCPMCHLSVIVVRDSEVECATCGATGNFTAGPQVRWTRLDTSIISIEEQRAHFREIVETARSHMERRETIEQRATAFDAYDPIVRPAAPTRHYLRTRKERHAAVQER
jgi:multimeric flavodoxin WrbA